MRTVEMPELRFSNWYSWEKRNKYPKCQFPGVYLIAITDKDLDGQEVQWEDVCYIGMSKSKGGLRQRWQQFHNSIRGRREHSGGMTICADLGPYPTASKWQRLRLYVAAMAIECNVVNRSVEDLIRMGWVAYLEYEAFARRRQIVGKGTIYNKQ